MSESRSRGEFSCEFSLADLDDEAVFEVIAGADELAALARRFDLVALESLAATVTLKRLRDGAVRLRARLAAEVVQSCVVTLEPVAGRIDESIEVLFAPPGAELAQGPEVVIATAGENWPEPLIGDSIDVGEVLAEHFGLALDPYPRLPGSVFQAPEALAEQITAEAANSPFAALRDRKFKT